MKFQRSKILTLSPLMALLFFPINSWPRDIRNLFHKSKNGNTNTFKVILFTFGNNISFIWSWIFFPFNTRRNLPRFPNEFSRHSESLIPSLRKNIYGITSIFPSKISPFRWLFYPLKPLEQHINISQPLLLFHSFRNLPLSQKLWRSLRRYGGHEHMWLHPRHVTDLGYKPLVTSAILTNTPEVHSFTLPSSKQKRHPNEESNCKTIETCHLLPYIRQKPPSNPQIPKLIRKLSLPLLMALSFIPPTLQQAL